VKNSSNLSETKIIKSDNHCTLCGALSNRLIDDEPKPGFYYCTRCYRHYPKKIKFQAILLDENPVNCLKCGSLNFIEDTRYKSEIDGIDYLVTTIFCLNCKEVIVYCLLFDRIFSSIARNVRMIKNIGPISIFSNRKKIMKCEGTTIENSKTETSEIHDLPNQINLLGIKTKMSITHEDLFFKNRLKDVNELIGLFSKEEDHSYYILSQLVPDIFHIRKIMKSLQLELQNFFSEFMITTNKLETRAEDGEIYADKILKVVNDRSVNTKIILIDLINYINWRISTTLETREKNEEAGQVVNSKKRDNELMWLSEMCHQLIESLNMISSHPSIWTIFHGSTQLTSEYESFKVLQDSIFSFNKKNGQVKESNQFFTAILDKFDGLEFKMKKIRSLLETSKPEALSYEKDNASKPQKIDSLQYLIEQLREKNDKLISLVNDV